MYDIDLDNQHFFKAALKKNLSPSYVREDLTHLGLSEDKAEWFCAQWKNNLPSMSRIAAGQSLTVNQLLDMEWRFGGKERQHLDQHLVSHSSIAHAVTATNSDMKKVGNTFLQLKLVLDKGIGTEEVFMGKLFLSC